MTTEPALRGAWTALVTPFASDGGVDVGALRALCRRQVEAGVGLVPCGTTGETPTLTSDEYDLVVRTAVEVAAGAMPVIAGTGSNSTRGTIANTQRARELGADAALVVVPYYNKPPQSALLTHFRAVADEGGLPVVLYNVPGRSACNMSADTSLALAEHPNIVAIKEASADLDQIQRLIFEAPAGFSVLSGDDAWTLPMLLLGGHGVVSVAGNVVPRSLAALVEAGLGGDADRSRTLQATLLPLFRALFLTTNPIPVKRAAQLLGQGRAELRPPLAADALTDAMLADLQTALDLATGLESEA